VPSKTDRTDGEIDWPHWQDRTSRRRRESTSKYSTTLAKSISHIEKELEDRLGVDDWRLSTAAPHRKNDGRPYANANPTDPGAVVRWSMDGQQYCIAADHYDGLRDNVRTIGLYIKEKRKMSNRPVHTGQDEFATAQLPSGNEDVIVAGDGSGATATASTKAPHEVLEVDPDASDDVVKAVARRKAANVHPDTESGDREAYKQVQQAKEVMLND